MTALELKPEVRAWLKDRLTEPLDRTITALGKYKAAVAHDKLCHCDELALASLDLVKANVALIEGEK